MKKKLQNADKVPEPFFLVARLDGIGCGPQKRHPTVGAATEEAERLARKERKVEFFVLAPIKSIVEGESPLLQTIYKASRKS